MSMFGGCKWSLQLGILPVIWFMCMLVAAVASRVIPFHISYIRVERYTEREVENQYSYL